MTGAIRGLLSRTRRAARPGHRSYPKPEREPKIGSHRDSCTDQWINVEGLHAVDRLRPRDHLRSDPDRVKRLLLQPVEVRGDDDPD